MKKWSDALIAKTRQELEDMLTYTDPSGKMRWLIDSMDLDKGAHFKNIDGERFGIMAAEDACNAKYNISLKNNNEQETFKTIDELLDAGWVLD